MGLLSAVTNRVQTAVKQVERTIEQNKPAAMPAEAKAVVDAFTPSVAVKKGAVALCLGNTTLASASASTDGLKVTLQDTTFRLTQSKGMGVSQTFLGHQFGVHAKLVDGAATLGAVSVEAAGRETAVGMVPAAPAPVIIPVYSGTDRDGEKS